MGRETPLSNSQNTRSREPQPVCRRDVQFFQQRRRGQGVWVAKDPITLRYFEFTDQEYAIIRWLDGSRGIHEICQLYQESYSPQKMTPAALRSFINGLQRHGILQSTSTDQSVALWRRSQKQNRERWLASLSNPLAIRIPDSIQIG